MAATLMRNKSKIMARIFMLFTFLLSYNLLSAQCCSESLHCDFKKLADNSNFRSEHEVPGDFKHEGKGAMIAYLLKSGMKASAFEVKTEGSDKFLIMIHE